MTRASAGKFYYRICVISVILCRDSIIAVDQYFSNGVRCVMAFMVGLDKQPVDTDSS